MNMESTQVIFNESLTSTHIDEIRSEWSRLSILNQSRIEKSTLLPLLVCFLCVCDLFMVNQSHFTIVSAWIWNPMVCTKRILMKLLTSETHLKMRRKRGFLQLDQSWWPNEWCESYCIYWSNNWRFVTNAIDHLKFVIMSKSIYRSSVLLRATNHLPDNISNGTNEDDVIRSSRWHAIF